MFCILEYAWSVIPFRISRWRVTRRGRTNWSSWSFKGILRKPSALSYEWHIRLGHPGEKQFIHLEKDLDLCEHCSLAKSTWQISEYSTTQPEVTRPFEVIHIDLCGPFYRPLAYGNTRYFLTIVDRLSLWNDVSTLARKSEAARRVSDLFWESASRLRIKSLALGTSIG